MKSLEEIRKSLDSIKGQLFTKCPIKYLAIFGSFSRNEQSENSDLDLMVEFNASVGSQFISLADELEELIGCKVDLVSKKAIKEKYFRSIESDIIYV